ncbi:NAD-dependent epimerase/dehydratase family protein [Pedobacter sp. AW1-32]|uniref:NAD-dependent epimerase/dehydratase family protein n=1 Tax=Pedobacter sp. AW1-32 TaxID=3383026 RepID=UPI003FF11A60
MMKLLILGGGAVFQEYYLPALQYLDKLKDVTIVECSLNLVEELQKMGIEAIHSDFESFMNQNEKSFDRAIITLPNHLHEQAITCCLQSGLAVLCEKPLAMTLDSCKRLLLLENTLSKKVYAAMVRRLMPSFKALKKSIKLLGDIKSVHIEDGNSYAWVADSYAFFDPKNGGVLADMGIHYLDLLIDLFDQVKCISYSDDAEGGVEANCTLHLESYISIPISLKLSRTKKLKNTFEIIGENGSLWMEKNVFDRCFFSPEPGVVHEIKLSQVFTDADLPYTFHACFVEQLINYLDDKTTNLVGLEQATQGISVIDWAYQNQNPYKKPENIPDCYLVTGATGFIGTALVERLWKNGVHQITAPVRSYKNCASIARFAIDLPRLNLLDYAAVMNQMKGKKYVVHLAYSTDGNNAFEVNVTATQNIVKAACEEGVEAIVILSTMNVFGFPNGLVTEQSPMKPVANEYGKTKKIMQEWCINFAKNQHKTRIVVLNPTCVYGSNGKTYTSLPVNLNKTNQFCWIENGTGLANVVYIENLLDAILQALIVKKAHGQSFIINDETLTWKDFLLPLLNPGEQKIRNLSSKELISRSFKEKSSVKKIIRYLLTNYELVSLINQHPILGGLKKNVFKMIPGFRSKLDSERKMEWNSKGFEELSKTMPSDFDPPIWLNELFGATKSTFSAERAKQILDWKSKVSLQDALKTTQKWLRNQN